MVFHLIFIKHWFNFEYFEPNLVPRPPQRMYVLSIHIILVPSKSKLNLNSSSPLLAIACFNFRGSSE